MKIYLGFNHKRENLLNRVLKKQNICQHSLNERGKKKSSIGVGKNV